MKKLKKVVTCLSILTMVTTLAAGCSKKNDVSSKSAKSALDTSKRVQLNMYLMGDEPKDNAKIVSALNKLTKKDLNATVKITYSTWTDFSTKYNLMLTSGENMDLVYGANWLTYATYAKKGAFTDLTDMISKYAPELSKEIPKERWEGTKVNDKLYAVPNQNPEFTQGAFVYREDLREKYNLPKINSVDSIEAYFDGIKKNNHDIMLTNDSGSCAYNNLFMFTTKYEIVDKGDEATSNLVIDPKNPKKVLATIELPEYKAFVEKMKNWADKGFWSKSALSSNEDGIVSFENGKAAASFNSTLAKAKGTVEKLAKSNPDWKVGVFEYNRLMNKVHSAAVTQNLTVIPKVSNNPERALALIQKLQTDRRYYDIIQYGIKGLTYNLTQDGKLDYSKINTTKHSAPSGWAFRNAKLDRANVSDWSEWKQRNDEDKKLATPDILDAFTLDTDPVQNEYAAITQVTNQYGKPLNAGLVKDADAAYASLLNQAKAAGLEKYRTEVEKQVDEYLKEKGIK
ncbi:ABC transporter substrate-binding protein [Clostridium oryzae]|uniref:Bacterial extracellular solute-binding protein n=1 Tax=Clostridium oryzae TaxID=1450648 RepID=A0A1V4I9M8_9CLOT|nr:ABC transporter substrate-binding protein [Clostridium oryzae]OPJ56708.1 bacterial extracellular solute-binding protein [Clostridium oryzae]